MLFVRHGTESQQDNISVKETVTSMNISRLLSDIARLDGGSLFEGLFSWLLLMSALSHLAVRGWSHKEGAVESGHGFDIIYVVLCGEWNSTVCRCEPLVCLRSSPSISPVLRVLPAIVQSVGCCLFVCLFASLFLNIESQKTEQTIPEAKSQRERV